MGTTGRSIRPEEAEVVRTVLTRAPRQPVDASVIEAIASLRVVGGCRCGCASIDFERKWTTRHGQVADGIGKTASGGQVGVILWGRRDAISSLEIYDLGAGQSDLRLPVPETIRPYEADALG
ncbi:MAG: hypothetical protein K8S98_15495 [Planctomycetes bacterium]|nr:hypothetical protein [Planctomycetota bacterium]